MTVRFAPIRRFLIAALFTGTLAGAPGLASAEPFFNCVQFVKETSPVSLSGDAYKWWDAAAGLYSRGNQPKPGAVMVFAKTNRLPHGHVAIIDRLLDSRTALIDHANWSRIAGRRGHVERAVEVIDVSPNNDWSRVKVWYHSLGDVGDSVYKVSGFIYSHGNGIIRAAHHRR